MQQMNRPDPAPSKWSYRFQRMMLTPFYRRLLKTGVPLAVIAISGAVYFSDADRRQAIANTYADLRNEIETRPEFMVNLMAIDGASDLISQEIRTIVPIEFPVTSFDLDLDSIRRDIIELAAVKDATVRVRSGGVLQIDIKERYPAALWRSRHGLALVDAEGVSLRQVKSREPYASLPVIAGDGAADRVPEAMELFRAALPLGGRLRGVVRMGERRWDVVLDRDQRILLPETDPIKALERVIALSKAQDMLQRDLIAVDMRLSDRPTIRMNDAALKEWWRVRDISFKE